MVNILHSFYRPICLTLLLFLGLACGHLVDVVLQVNLRPEREIRMRASMVTALVAFGYN